MKRGWWVGETAGGAGRLRLEKEAMRVSVASMSVFRCLDIGAGGRGPSVDGQAKVWWWISLLKWGGCAAMRSVYGSQGRMRFAMDFEHFLWKVLMVDLRVECMILS